MAKRDEDDILEVAARWRDRYVRLRSAGDGRERVRHATLSVVLAGVGAIILFGGFRQGPWAEGGLAGVSGGYVPFVISLSLISVGHGIIRSALTTVPPTEPYEDSVE
jgi:hypothetical protein